MEKRIEDLMKKEIYNRLTEGQRKPIQLNERMEFRNYCKANGIEFDQYKVTKNGERIGNVICTYSSKKVCLTYPIKSVRIEWFAGV